MAKIELPVEDQEPVKPASVDAPELTIEQTPEYACIVCGEPLTYAGKGTKPKYCADHKNVRPSRPAGGSATKPISSRASKDEKIGAQIANTITLVGMSVMAVNAYDGLVLIDRAQPTADALMDVAAHNPQVRKLLEQFANVSVYGQLAAALAGLAVPIAANHGLLPLPQTMIERQFLSEEMAERLSSMRIAEEMQRMSTFAPEE